MDYNTIKALLDKYFAGESSLAEEAQLRSYFQRGEVHQDFQSYQALFGFFAQEKKQATSPDFEKRFAPKPPARKSKLRVLRIWSAAAAVLLLLTATWLWYPSEEGPITQVTPIDWSQYEPATDEEALEVTKGALLRTSKAMYQGINQAMTEVESVKKIMQWD